MLHLALGLYASPLCISDALALLNSQALLNAVANTASFADLSWAGARQARARSDWCKNSFLTYIIVMD